MSSSTSDISVPVTPDRLSKTQSSAQYQQRAHASMASSRYSMSTQQQAAAILQLHQRASMSPHQPQPLMPSGLDVLAKTSTLGQHQFDGQSIGMGLAAAPATISFVRTVREVRCRLLGVGTLVGCQGAGADAGQVK